MAETNIIVEYSHTQKAYHISTKEERIENEKICAIKGVNTGYEVVFECDSYEKAYNFIEYELKLNILLSKIRKEAICRFEHNDMDSYNVEIDSEINKLDRQLFRGKIIDAKKHGIKALALISNLIIKKC